MRLLKKIIDNVFYENKFTPKRNILNLFLYSISTCLLYFLLYILLSKRFIDFYKPYIGAVILISSILIDLFFAGKKIRIFVRFLIIISCFFALKFLVYLFTAILSPFYGYNLFTDKIPYLFARDTLVSVVFIIFYFIFDSARIIKVNRVRYFFSTLIILIAYILCFGLDLSNIKIIFGNDFNIALFIISVVILIIFRHVIFYNNKIERKFEKRDILLLIPIFIIMIIIFFIVIIGRGGITEENKNNILTESIFGIFDFSDYLELKEEIKQSDERVLIMELQGVRDDIRNRINKGWNRQIYLKRFALEEYLGNGKFKVADSYNDPYAPPVYLSGYMWKSKKDYKYKNRIDVIETLYLVNIDPSSLLGSDYIKKVVPLTNWINSPFKKIYKSYCSVQDINYSDLLFKDLTQEKFLKELHPERRNLLLNWGDNENEGRIKQLAESITKNIDSTIYKTMLIQDYLRDELFYSLKPGMARNGKQLDYFLFESKKGYCSYFAFAMTLMLRSIGIPARVVVGFAPDMKNSTLNFYDVRSLHGHAWVEVFFDDYGWLTFDPTSSNIAPDESYEFFEGNKEERNDLIEEILKNKDKLNEITEERDDVNIFEYFSHKVKYSFRWFGFILLLVIIILIFSFIILKKKYYYLLYKFSNGIKKKIITLYKDILARLFDLGYSINTDESIAEYAVRLKHEGIIDIVKLTEYFQKAVFKDSGELDIDYAEIVDMRKTIIIKLKKFKLKKRIKAFFNIARLWRKILPVIFIIFSLSVIKSSTDDINALDDYIIEAKIAIYEGYYDKAIEILNKAEEKFPKEYMPNLEKGKLFFGEDLYESALTEFLKAKYKGCETEENYQYIANSYGNLGEYRKAVKIYEEAFDKLYPSINLYDKLSWMYYKVNDINKGVEKVLEGLNNYPNSPDLLMMLGTLYSSVYDYRKSKQSYLDAIYYSYEHYNSNYFRSIVYYNLSLLEKTFLEYENAYESTKNSISSDNRGSPHLQLNYLYLGALDLKNAYNEILKASTLRPHTLFPQVSLVYIYMISGRVDEAINLIKTLLHEKDFSWMLYFGTNKDEYYSELYMELSLAYEFKYKQLSFYDKQDFIHSLARPFKKIYYWILSKFYNFRYANLYIKIGEEKITGGGILEGYNYLIEAYNRIWQRKALKVLKLAEQIELKANPKKQTIYDIKKAILKEKCSIFYTKRRKRKVLIEKYKMLDPKWEKDIMADTLLEIIKSSKGKVRDRYIEELFTIHPPMLPMNNIKTKIKIKFNNDDFDDKSKKKIIKSLKKRGILYSPDSRFTLNINKITNKEYSIGIYNYNRLIFEERIVLEKYKKQNVYNDISLEIFKKIFIAEID